MKVSDFKRDDAASYDTKAQHYERHIGLLGAPLAKKASALAAVKQGDRVLDVGCGTGIASREAGLRVGSDGSVIGIDISAGMVAIARASTDTSNVQFRVMDAEHLDFPDAAFDAVISLCAVLHFPAISTALGEMRRVLRPGGPLVVSFGYARPGAATALVGHVIREAGHRARRDEMAPRFLLHLIDKLTPEPVIPIHTNWAGHDSRRSLVRLVREAGLVDVHTAWFGHQVNFDDPDAFCEAQLAIVTTARRRLELAGPEVATRIRDMMMRRYEDVLKRGGKLVYPYAAFFVTARNA